MAGVRNTKQKQAVYEALCSLDHPTATEVYDCVHEKYPNVSRGTVFRVLGGFADTGRARRLRLADSDVRYDPTLSPHAHARCKFCGCVRDVFSESFSELLTVRAEGFTIDGAEVEYSGVCDRCKRKQNT